MQYRATNSGLLVPNYGPNRIWTPHRPPSFIIDPKKCPPLPDVGRMPMRCAIAFVQSPAGGVTGTASSVNLAFGSNCTAGNCIVCVWRYSVGGLTVTLSDTQSNTYTSNAVEQIVTGDGNATVGIGYALNIAGGATTVTFSVGVSRTLRFLIAEFSGVATSSAFDQSNHAEGSGTAIASGSVTPTTDGQLLVCGYENVNTSATSVGTDFTLASQTANDRTGLEYYIQTTAAAHDGTWTQAASQVWGAVIGTFKAPGAAASPLFLHHAELTGTGVGGPFFRNPLS